MNILKQIFDYARHKQIPRRAFARRGIVRENIGERTVLSGWHQVMDA